jgi:Asparagine synthase (glutamine-hydrolyzing)
VAKKFAANHHEIVINDDDFISFLPRMSFYQDEPLADPVCVPLYYLSRLARDAGVPVIQVGEGSDEIFAGYRMYHFFNRLDRSVYRPFLRLPSTMRSIIYRTSKSFVSPEKRDSLRRAVNKDPFFLGNAIAFWDTEKDELLKHSLGAKTSSAYIKGIKRNMNIDDSLLSIINIELKNRLPELLLMRVDKMSMAHSIETRVPFLDEDLVAFALQIPSSLKLKDGEPKYILKKAAEGIIPNDIIYRKKMGFCGSATNMLSAKVTAFARETILGSRLTDDLFNRAYIERLFKDHQHQKRFNSFKIWNLMNLALWHEQWFGVEKRVQLTV